MYDMYAKKTQNNQLENVCFTQLIIWSLQLYYKMVVPAYINTNSEHHPAQMQGHTFTVIVIVIC